MEGNKIEQYGIENIDRMGDLRLEEIIYCAMNENRDLVNSLREEVEEGHSRDNFKEALFSNLKVKIVEKLAGEMGMENPDSKDAWNQVMEEYPLEKLKELSEDVAEKELKNWNL